MPLSQLCHRPPHWLLGLLILSLLAPGLVPVQGHTHQVQDAAGHWYTLCTWQDHDQQHHTPEPWQSPAYAYAVLLGGAATAPSLPSVATPLFIALTPPAAPAATPTIPQRLHQQIRAPPVVSALPIPC
jgi:hypothetical protein